jgi:hypothetical protein
LYSGILSGQSEKVGNEKKSFERNEYISSAYSRGSAKAPTGITKICRATDGIFPMRTFAEYTQHISRSYLK